MIALNKEITWDGHLFEDKLMLDLKIKYLTQEREIPAESILATRLELVNSEATEYESIQNGCKVIVWESRVVFNINAGGADLIRVPVCD